MSENQITSITTEQLKSMNNKGGIIFQGCGGDLQEWLDGVNEMLTEAGILKDGSQFRQIYSFEHQGITNLLFPFDGTELDMGKLAMWRLESHSTFGGTWIEDYLENKLGFTDDEPEQVEQVEPVEQEKPDAPLLGADSNIFNLMGIAARALRRNHQPEQAKEMCERIRSSGSYDNALAIIMEYVNVTSADEQSEGYVHLL
jgi:hypothetical protein